MPDFDWESLKDLLAIVRAGRLTTAAKRLRIDHSTLSRRISGLESTLGAKLFDRRTGGYTLTQEGEALVGEAEMMESAAIRIQSRLDNAVPTLAGCVRVGTPEGFGTYFLAGKLSRLTARHPDLEVEIIASPSLFSLSKREADLAVTMARPTHGPLHARKLTDYELGVYVARSYLEKHGPFTQQSQLVSHPWVGYIPDLMASPELNFFPQISGAIQPRIRISNVITQMQAVGGSAGFGVLPCFMAGYERELVRVLPEEARIFRSYWLVTHSGVRELARIKTAMDFIYGCVQEGSGVFLPAGPRPAPNARP